MTAPDDALNEQYVPPWAQAGTTSEVHTTAPATPPASEEPPSRHWRTAISWGVTILFALLLTIVVQTWFYRVYSIPSASMVPTLDINDRVVVSKLNKDPGRGDIIVFQRPADDPAGPGEPSVLIKRVIGLPGDTVTSESGQVYIDGKRLREDYLPKGTTTQIAQPIHVPAGDLLVLGDNRSVSQDGRYFGPISKKLIVGRAILRIWPPSRIGKL